ncbi:Phthiotriol/phenolphthiotriol dimycocerosates methyltransferase [Trichostrongylus colubriformis]|uniref:Phthiotriol/phenolphthiotriol dimycocerosates methyltransferase n=1 Tax=Trichostrongylus colubriformis TaxID=6319 RepID=A0AAN8EW58_TRICO
MRKLCPLMGPKMSAFCMVMSVWGVIFLGLLGVFFYIQAVTLFPDLHFAEESKEGGHAGPTVELEVTTLLMQDFRKYPIFSESEYGLVKNLDRPHYYLYERALLFHCDYPALDGLQILEVGCGQGYGLEWIKRAHPEIKGIQGVDQFAIPGTSVIFGDAHHMPFENNRFDLVLNVESSHLYQHCEKFFRECSRVLKKGGHLCWIDLRFEREVAETRKQALRAGLVEQRWDDVTDNVLQGIHRTSARYDQILRKTPLLVRLFGSSLRATYCAPGTYTYARFVKREKGYYAAIWENSYILQSS